MGFYGLPTGSLENNYLQVDYLLGAGPRIVRLLLKDAPASGNLLAELPDKQLETPFGIYYFRGGHRLAYAPETFPDTYYPDNAGLTVEKVSGGVRLCQPVEPLTGIRKTLDIHLDPNRAALTLTHHLYNAGKQPIEIAPWGITQLPLGGAAIIPQSAPQAVEKSMRPNRSLVLWPYTHWGDARLDIHDEYVFVHALADLQPCKIGSLNTSGWVAYLNGAILMVKRFEPEPELPHADLGCNVEVYSNDQYIELETLAPMQRIQPTQEAVYPETWEFYTGLSGALPSFDTIRSMLEDKHSLRDQSLL